MTDGFGNKPRILRGAFVEVGLSLPPVVVAFQFNPLQLNRTRSVAFTAPNPPEGRSAVPYASLREFHGDYRSLLALHRDQLVTVDEQGISFDLRLDATDRLDGRDLVAEEFGVAPRLAALERMVLPKQESLLARTVGFSFTRSERPPLVLLVFGRKRVLPVNISSMTIAETEFSATLDPVRAIVSVTLAVIEGPNIPYTYSRAAIEALSALDLVDSPGVADVVVPG